MLRVARLFIIALAIGTWSTVMIAAMPAASRPAGDEAACGSDSGRCVCRVTNTDCECNGTGNTCSASCASGGAAICVHRVD